MSQNEFDFVGDIPIGEVTKRERIVYDYFVTIGDQEFNLIDLYKTLEDIDSGEIYFSHSEWNNADVVMFKNNEIIEDYGSRYSRVSKGKKFDEFFDKISNLIWNRN